MLDSAATSGPQRAALAGIRVIELANFVSGPFIGMQLADYGADVIKIEHPTRGDGIRTWGNRKNGIGLYHKVLNRNKKSVSADLGTPLGVEIVRRLVARADVVIENFRPGTLEEWGLGYDVLSAVNPGLVLVRVSGFGQTGPYRERSGFGSLAEAMTGFAYTNGFADRPPLLPSFAMADSTTGLAGAFLTLAALEARRNNGGKGQIIDLPIYEPMLSLMGAQVVDYDQLGIVQQRQGSRLPLVSPRNTFRTRDGGWIALSGGAHAVFQRLCTALNVPELADDPRFSDNQKRLENADAIEQALQDAIGKFTLKEVAARLREHDAPGAPVYSVADMFEDPHLLARENITTVADDELQDGIQMPNVIGKFSETPGMVRHAAQRLGASNLEVLVKELGFDADELTAAGIKL
ncbi:CoA transferase [Hyphomicrobium sp. CS1BSMeth3]|uniref:CaiB/BaiF CoA transferase family protein n=1 Tax=Hyphomicrobium sp. CS1BSMeth3 TaxID=1892844 RepID=UPI000930630E|nr:CoA transferase [Hyphomicrobium sp. CS1BSMeth3]